MATQNNSRVTLAVLKRDMEYMTRLLETTLAQVTDNQARIEEIAQADAVCRERWRAHQEEHRQLGVKSAVGDVVAGVTAVIAGILGIVVEK